MSCSHFLYIFIFFSCCCCLVFLFSYFFFWFSPTRTLLSLQSCRLSTEDKSGSHGWLNLLFLSLCITTNVSSLFHFLLLFHWCYSSLHPRLLSFHIDSAPASFCLCASDIRTVRVSIPSRRLPHHHALWSVGDLSPTYSNTIPNMWILLVLLVFVSLHFFFWAGYWPLYLYI